MTTPILDFVRRYAEQKRLRLHMPGHKGECLLGCEPLDITEVTGADSLFEADGIIAESEQNAGRLFGADTFYSTEGSSLSIRAMVYLVAQKALERGEKPLILAGRNAHRSFLSALALTGADVKWLLPRAGGSYLSCPITAQEVEAAISAAEQKPTAVYLTTPDYLGNMLDVAEIAKACHRQGVYLLVDNAHGAYLKFLPDSRHPIELGADLCCDSAHKTLPALTGAGYLHVSHTVSALFSPFVKSAMALFGSTSPSYLILQSLDAVNADLANGFSRRLGRTVDAVTRCKQRLLAGGYLLCGDEPMKITIAAKPYGYRGNELLALVEREGVICEFADPDFLVLMPGVATTPEELERLADLLCAIPRREPITEQAPLFSTPSRTLSVREAVFSPSETVAVSDALGRVLATASVACPPAVPIVISGERIDREALAAFAYYGIESCRVVKS